jgi:thiol:disulfide interchange protein DsbD
MRSMIAPRRPLVVKKTWVSGGMPTALIFLLLLARFGTAAAWVATAPLPAAQAADEKPLRHVELLVLEDRSTELTLGLHIELAPGWYLYWLNPGDAGLAPEVRWELPPGCEAGRLRFPTPQKIVHGGIVTYGFTDETLFLCDLRRPARSTAADKILATAVLEWMACRESCITGETAVQMDLSGLSSVVIQKSKPVFSRFASRYPKPATAAAVTAMEARLAKRPGRWMVEVILSGREAPRVSDFYPYPLEDFVIDHQGIVLSGEKIIIPVQPSSASAALSRISGLLIIDGTGFEVSTPVKE